MDDFHVTSPNDGTHWIRPMSASAETWWQKNNMSKFVVDNNEEHYIVMSKDGRNICEQIRKTNMSISD
jgi:hypothetical protein